jgi:hypothetical protein
MTEEEWASLDAAAVYTFPYSFAWGAVGWVDPKGNPTAPAADARVSAFLCDPHSCINLNIWPGYARSLRPNVNGILDPVGTAVDMVVAAWRGCHDLYPDVFPDALPDVNPNPYVPITTPIVFQTPASSPTGSPADGPTGSSALTPTTGPT